ncbi:MAG: peptidoglycan DD-metalloendopeptidase family protein [Anaerolineaceae bacterium]|nr:peptidoglycan DD-metalloendopeptidase family protein [Anaerolineaceae bacterium]
MLRKSICLIVLFVLAGCQSTSVTPTTVAALPTPLTNPIGAATAVPTANPIASRTATQPPTATFTPTFTMTPSLTPTLTFTPTMTYTPSDTPTATLSPTPLTISSATPGANVDANGTPIPTWTPPPADPSTQLADHYHFYRPIGEGDVNYVARTYPYGSTAGGLQIHLGVDLENPTGTNIIAAADGVVYYAGDDTGTQFGPTNTYYGNLVVIQHAFNAPDGKPVFSLYGHMQRVDVQTGQVVKKGDSLGIVGSTGVAFGPHLHFEVRLGDANSFHSTRNPELWIFPFRKFGTLVGRVTDASGTVLFNAPIQVKSVDIARYAYTYADTTVNPDDVFGENFVIGDLPANYYEVSVNDGGRTRFRKTIYIYPDRSTWIDIKLQ